LRLRTTAASASTAATALTPSAIGITGTPFVDPELEVTDEPASDSDRGAIRESTAAVPSSGCTTAVGIVAGRPFTCRIDIVAAAIAHLRILRPPVRRVHCVLHRGPPTGSRLDTDGPRECRSLSRMSDSSDQPNTAIDAAQAARDVAGRYWEAMLELEPILATQ